MDAEDITSDDVDLRFEDSEGRETGCDVSIVEYAERTAKAIEQVLANTTPQPAPAQDVAVTERMLDRAMNVPMPGGAPAWVWLFNCEGGQRPEEKHRDWFQAVLTAALAAHDKQGKNG